MFLRRTEVISLWSGTTVWAGHRSEPHSVAAPRREHAEQMVSGRRERMVENIFLPASTRSRWRLASAVSRPTAACTSRRAPGERTGWRWRTGGRRQASATWPWKPRRVLETDLQHLGKPLQGAAGECPSPETSAGAPERRPRRPGDRTPAAAGVVARQLPSAAARGAQPDPAPNAVGGSQGPHP